MKWTIAVVAAITIARIAWVNALPQQSYFAKYQYFADRAIAGHLDKDRLPDLSPGYLWFVVALRALGASVKMIRALQIVLISAAALALGAVARKLCGDLAALAAIVLVLANQAALVNASDLEPETLIVLLNALALWLLFRDKPLLAGLAIGSSIICRPVSLLIAAVLVAWFRRDARRFIAGAAVPIIIILGVNLALTGNAVIMDPGNAFYDGMNPQAGMSGVAPRIVKDLEPLIGGPDAMHVAYRLVAARAGAPRQNVYWTGKALAFMRYEPAAAAAVIGRRLRALVSGYDTYDTPSMELNRRQLAVVPVWISFALLIPLAGAGVRAETKWLAFCAAAAALPLAVFFVTARHRDPLLVPLAILGGCGIAALIERRRMAVAALVIVAALVLSLRHQAQEEDAFLWTATFAVNQLMPAGQIAAAATWLPENVPPAPPAQLRAAATAALRVDDSPSRRFSVAIALEHAGANAEAERLLRELQAEGFRPFRRSRGVSSVSYYLARALLAQNRRAEALPLVAQARAEAPGDADVLALSIALGATQFAKELDALYDPFTRERAMATNRRW
jgi:hypothetical protein